MNETNRNGILNVYKEPGFTSHDVVAKLRGILHMKKIGHTGTLDPEAAGVLPVCVGKATKVCGLLTDKDKTYQAQVKLGVTTDTQDLTGTVQSTQEVSVTEEQLRGVLDRFVGEIDQIPPMYSAIKVNGKKLYELARQGREIERKPRRVTIHRLALLDTKLSEGEFTIEVTCSKGTYIRTLCHDVGAMLGCGGAMKTLLRTRVDRFSIEEAKTLSEIEAMVEAGRAAELFMSIDTVFEKYRAGLVGERGLRFLKNGNNISDRTCSLREPKQGEIVRMYDEAGTFYALYRYEKKDRFYHVVKMFHET